MFPERNDYMNKLNILYTTDNNYFTHMLTSLYSLLKNNKDIFLNIHIIETNLTKENYLLLDTIINNYNNCNLNIYNLKELQYYIDLFDIPKWRNTDIGNARLFASELINEDKILYLDCDTIITSSLKDLSKYYFNTPISAVKEFTIPIHLRNKLINYYNSGVIYFNYKSWNEEDCIRELYNTLSIEKNNLIYPDQDLLNLALTERINTLDISYNIFSYIYEINKYRFIRNKYFTKNPNYYKEEEITESLNNPHILHMLEYLYIRPWEQNKIHPFNDIYREYREIWDKDFKQEKNNNILVQIKLLSYINILMKCLLSEETNNNIKSKVKRILKP